MDYTKFTQACELRPRPPFRLEPTVRVLQRRPTNRVDLWEDGRYWRVLASDAGHRLIVAKDVGTVDDPRLVVSIGGPALTQQELDRLIEVVRRLLGVDVETEGFYRLAEADPFLAPYAGALRGLKPPRFPSLMETFVNVVVFQQISLSAAVAITGRLAQRYGARVAQQGREYLGLPTAQTLAGADPAELRSLGLTRRKAEVLQALAAKIVAGELREERLAGVEREQAVGLLCSLPGIGRWSAELVLLRGFGRLDVFPTGDAGIRRGLGSLYGRAGPLAADEERELAERYGGYRGLLYLHVAAARLLSLGVLSPAHP